MKTSSILNFRYLISVALKSLTAIGIYVFVIKPITIGNQLSPMEAKLQEFHAIKDKLEAIVVGNSHGRSFHFESLNLVGMNFFDAASDIEEASTKAKDIVNHYPNVKYIFIPISPGSLSFSQKYVSNNYRIRRVNNRINSPKTLEPIEFISTLGLSIFLHNFLEIKKFQTKVKSTIKGESIKLVNKECYYYESSQDVSSVIEDGIIGGYPRQLMKPDCLSRSAHIAAGTLEKMILSSSKRDKKIVEENVRRLKRLAEFLSKKDKPKHLILVVPPVTEEYHTNEFIQKLERKHSIVLKALYSFENIEVLDFHDYLFNTRNRLKNKYFHDADHLALPGAMKFSKALSKKLGIQERRVRR